jgi:hypothetical protein
MLLTYSKIRIIIHCFLWGVEIKYLLKQPIHAFIIFLNLGAQ